MDDKLNADDQPGVTITIGPGITEQTGAMGVYEAECVDADGNVRWSEKFPNVVVTVGKNQGLDNWLAGSAWTMTGPFMGLVSSTSFSAFAATDTMSSHAGWLEAGSANAPTFSARGNLSGGWSAASAGSKALASAQSFSITGNGTIQGAFLVGGSGAVATIANTSGTLISAGNFTGGTRAVLNGDTVNVSYAMSI
jgi:hypothetical protein